MITVTDRACKKIQSQLAKRGTGLGLRIGVKTTGCSGLAYVLEYVDHAPITKDQFVYESHGIKVWIDEKSAVYMDGLEIDWIRNGLNEGFEFRNPNSKGECGCGESFRV